MFAGSIREKPSLSKYTLWILCICMTAYSGGSCDKRRSRCILVRTVLGCWRVCICYVDVHRRLWLTPSLSGQPETLNCYDFEPTGTNDLRSLVAKVNRKLSRNQFKGLRVLFLFVTH